MVAALWTCHTKATLKSTGPWWQSWRARRGPLRWWLVLGASKPGTLLSRILERSFPNHNLLLFRPKLWKRMSIKLGIQRTIFCCIILFWYLVSNFTMRLGSKVTEHSWRVQHRYVYNPALSLAPASSLIIQCVLTSYVIHDVVFVCNRVLWA